MLRPGGVSSLIITRVRMFRGVESRFFQFCTFLNMLNHFDVFCNRLLLTGSSAHIPIEGCQLTPITRILLQPNTRIFLQLECL